MARALGSRSSVQAGKENPGVVDFGASMHMISRKDLNSARVLQCEID